MHNPLPRLPLRPSRDWRVCLVLALALAGCTPPKKPTAAAKTATPSTQLSSSDPCPQRLHDLEGGLLLYYASNRRLPQNLTSLVLPGTDATAAAEAMVCPTSNQPYVYDPRGLSAPDGKSRLVVYDSVPAHSGRRWAISIVEGDGTQPLIAEVIPVAEAQFAAPPGR